MLLLCFVLMVRAYHIVEGIPTGQCRVTIITSHLVSVLSWLWKGLNWVVIQLLDRSFFGWIKGGYAV